MQCNIETAQKCEAPIGTKMLNSIFVRRANRMLSQAIIASYEMFVKNFSKQKVLILKNESTITTLSLQLVKLIFGILVHRHTQTHTQTYMGKHTNILTTFADTYTHTHMCPLKLGDSLWDDCFGAGSRFSSKINCLLVNFLLTHS